MIIPVKKKTYGHIWGIGHVWVLKKKTCFGAVLQLDMFCSSVTSMWTRLWESDTFGEKDTFLSVTYILEIPCSCSRMLYLKRQLLYMGMALNQE